MKRDLVKRKKKKRWDNGNTPWHVFVRTWRENSLSQPCVLECLPSPTLDLLKRNNKSVVHKCVAYKHGPVAEKRICFVLYSTMGMLWGILCCCLIGGVWCRLWSVGMLWQSKLQKNVLLGASFFWRAGLWVWFLSNINRSLKLFLPGIHFYSI